MRGAVVLLCAGSAVFGVVACGLTADYSGLRGGTRAGPDSGSAGETDGSADGSEMLPGEASTDAGSDAVTDSAPAVDAADSGPSFCATLTTPVKLCTDFDEGQPVDAGWGATDIYGGEAISVSSTAFSPPGSFLSAVNPSGAPSSARLLQTVTTSAANVHLDFEMLLAPSDGTFELAAVHQVIADGTTYGLFYREAASTLQVELKTLSGDGSMFDQTWPVGDGGAIPASWVRVTIDLDVSDTGSFTVTHDGATVLAETNVPTSTPSRTAMFVELGFYSFTPATGQANFDNAIVDWP